MTNLVNQDCSYVKGFVWAAQIKEKAGFLAKKPEWGESCCLFLLSKNHSDRDNQDSELRKERIRKKEPMGSFDD
ncbi:hypothetical protein AYI74_06480 [Shewanella algae]|nr:hypothetical protein AYI77_12345 [Shewanella algae]TWU69118.1 hypothetical protein AYI74_06480 [Shewanella algae]